MTPGEVDRRLESWLESESEYRKAVTAIVSAHRSGAVTREAVLALAEVRARADVNREHYLKLVLPATARR